MSGLEPLAALGLVCNILQLVELGQKTIDCIKTVYQEGKLDEELEQNAVELNSLASQVRKESRPGNKKYETILFRSATSCATAARDLQEELRFLFGNAKRGSIASAARFTATVKWRQNRLDRLRRSLEMEENRLQTGLLAQVWSSTNAAHIDTRGVRRELRYFIEQYRQGRRETTELVSSEGLKTRDLVSREAERTNEAVALIDQKLGRLELCQGAEIDTQVREQFLKSLKYPGFNQRRNQIDNAYGDTLKWIFVGDNEDGSDQENDSWSGSDTGSTLSKESEEDPEPDTEASLSEEEYADQELFSRVKWDSFSNWLRSTDAIYWISGKPGSGKTTLVKYILAHSRTKMYLNVWSPGCEIISHYFWLPGSPMQRNLEGMFCSLLYQLLGSNNTALTEIMSSVSGPKESLTDWSSTELRSALLRALDSCNNGVCLFLDGLDEIKPEDETRDGIPELLKLVSDLAQTGKIKLCLASRPNPHVLETRLRMHPRLRLQDLNYEDLVVYAEEHVKYPQTGLPEEHYDLIDSLVVRAEGVFLWLILAIKSINEGISHHDSTETLDERIKRLPKGLNSLYHDMWARAGADSPSEYRETAALYFKLLLIWLKLVADFFPSDSARGGSKIFYEEASVFDIMLATTPIADGIFEALDEPSKLIGQDVMQQKCREVERKLKIYCIGLVEEITAEDERGEQASDCSWYGHTYDSIWNVETGRRLDFIHRTVSDFLTDTETGAKILNLDTSSGFALDCQLTKAWLAKLAIFANHESVEFWPSRLTRIRNTWIGTKEWVSKDWDRLVLMCEKLANSGRLFVGNLSFATPCGGSSFLRVLAFWNSDDETIISRLKSKTLSDNDKSAILMGLSQSSYVSWDGGEDQSRLPTFRELMWAGADPNWRTWETRFGWSVASPQTPWLAYLLNLMSNFADPDFTNEPKQLSTVAGIAFVFISEGANLDDTVNMFWKRNAKDFRHWVPSQIQGIYSVVSDGVCASIPAYLVIKILTDILRVYSGSDKDFCLDICVGLERACLNHRSNKSCRVFGKREFRNGEFVVYENTDEIQTELGNNFIKVLKKQISLTKPVIEDDIVSDMNDSGQTEVRESIFNHESWIEVIHGRGGLQKWLEDRELLKVVDISLGIEDWVRIHSQGITIPSRAIK